MRLTTQERAKYYYEVIKKDIRLDVFFLDTQLCSEQFNEDGDEEEDDRDDKG